MPSLPLRPRSASELVDAAFQILRGHYPHFVMGAAIAYVPLLLVQVALVSDPVRLVSRPELSFVIYLCALLDHAVMSAILLVCAAQAYLGDPVDVGAAVRKALPKIPAVLVSSIVRYIGVVAGMFVFLVGAPYIVARWFAVTPVLVLERRGLGGAFSRSSALSRGQKLHILATLLLTSILYLMLAFGGQVVVFLLVKNLVVQAVVTALLTILIYPVVAITYALLYFDTRIKNEGFDIELMTNALEGGSAVREPAAS
jgi:hypothetical protein